MTERQTTPKPWPKWQMQKHVAQRIREYADIAYRRDGDEISLRENGEFHMLATVEAAIADAGWKISHG